MEQNPYQAPRADVAGVGAAVLSSGRYEFTAIENMSIERTGRRSRTWGVMSLVVGVLALVAAIGGAVALAAIGTEEMPIAPAVVLAALLPVVVVHIAVGWLYIAAGRALGAVVETEGNDVELLMTGLEKMATAFRIEVIMTIIGFVIGLAIGISAAVAG